MIKNYSLRSPYLHSGPYNPVEARFVICGHYGDMILEIFGDS
jgi:hypothetical protein